MGVGSDFNVARPEHEPCNGEAARDHTPDSFIQMNPHNNMATMLVRTERDR